jgi:hypothetical protein
MTTARLVRGSIHIFEFNKITFVASNPKCMLNALEIGKVRS